MPNSASSGPSPSWPMTEGMGTPLFTPILIPGMDFCGAGGVLSPQGSALLPGSASSEFCLKFWGVEEQEKGDGEWDVGFFSDSIHSPPSEGETPSLCALGAPVPPSGEGKNHSNPIFFFKKKVMLPMVSIHPSFLKNGTNNPRAGGVPRVGDRDKWGHP